MKIYYPPPPETKIYIICPGKYNSGGPELCHQLCSQLIQFGADARMVYIEEQNFNDGDPVHDFYKKYHLPYTFEVEDAEQNILIVPEFFSEYLYMFKKIRRVFWWMSVDNYIKITSIKINSWFANPFSMPIPKLFCFGKSDDNLSHFVQSEYARQFVKFNDIANNKIYSVGDYLNQTFLRRAAQVDLSRKENFVVYNPSKGFEVTQQLINFAPDIAWRPIQNMTPEQVQELLAKAKVYIDFGNHPGKDRIPREAAISGCVVITGRRGAAANNIDINIPDEFKFDENTARLQQIIEKIREVFGNFKANHEKQAAYRARILDDKNRFANEVAEAFGIKNLPPPTVAFIQGVGEKTFILAQGLFQSEEFLPIFIVDDRLATTEFSDEFILREQNRNYLRVGENVIEIITRDDAKFLYLEGRIKKFALLEPTNSEIAEFQNFYQFAAEDILTFYR